MSSKSSYDKVHSAYWRRNVLVMVVLLIAWGVVGLGGGILFADTLNEVNLPGTGFPLGFWMAQQGSIIGFVVIILIYCISLNFLDGNHEEQMSEIDGGDNA